MTEVFQLFTVVVVGGALAAWGLYQGRREREAERRPRDERQQSIHFPEHRDADQHRGVAMSRLS